METRYSKPSPPINAVAAKAAYSIAAGKRLADSRRKLERLRATVRHAVAMENLKSSNKLARAQQAMEKRLAIAESRLSELRKSDPREWLIYKEALEDALEDFSRSINTLVTRIKDESS